jgi:glycosyltransferase involved in cell wall biosynthesis
MRVLVATDQWFPDVQGGLARVATETARRLAEREHEVTVLAPRSSAGRSEIFENGVRVLRVLPRRLLPQTLSDPAATWAYARRLRALEFDAVVAHQSTTAVGLSVARLGAPLALVYHASARREVRFLRARRRPGARRVASRALETVLALLERAALRRVNRLVVLSEFSRSLVAEDDPRAAEMAIRVSGGVNVATFSPGEGVAAARKRLGLASDGIVLLTVRRLEPRMGLETLLTAFARLRAPTSPELFVVGGGSLEETLRRLTSELGLDRRVHFVGRTDDETLQEWYRAADLFVLPTVAYEGFGVATIEALASGTPVVGTPVGATAEILFPLDPRLVASGSDPESLAEALDGALAFIGPELRARCREYACARYAWETVMNDWERALLGETTKLGSEPDFRRKTVGRSTVPTRTQPE